jgi:thiol-disulfide isomerase/thioredoxin
MCCRTPKAGNPQAKISQLLATGLTLVLATICGFSNLARGQNTPLQIRLEKALENARSITNVEIQYDEVMWKKGRPDSPSFADDFTLTSHITYIASDGKYRTKSQNESLFTNIIKFSEAAFDGKVYSEIDSRALMVQQDSDVPGDGNPFIPLMLPFLFLSRHSDDCLSCGLRFTDLRSPGFLNGLLLPDAEGSNGMLQVSFPGLPLLGVNQSWSITVDCADPDFKPRSILHTVHAGDQLPFDVQTTYTFSDYTNIGAYHFPAKMAYRTIWVPTNHLLATTLTDRGMAVLVSLKIPRQIPDSTFRLDESKAAHIWNSGQTKGYGVGLILGEAGSNIVVKRIIADSPAGAQNELRVGDRILSIAESDESPVLVHAGKADLPRANALLRGAKGTALRLAFVPSGSNDSPSQFVTLVRGEVSGQLSGGRLLTNGMKAPNIEMVLLTNHTTEHLSDFAGKIVVLEFWASWCSPCQKSMADLQLCLARYPNWKDNVVLIAASVDDSADIAAKYIRSKGWNQTHNVWLKGKDIQACHVGGIPAACVIDASGTVSASGIAGDEGLKIAEIVNQRLDATRKESRTDLLRPKRLGSSVTAQESLMYTKKGPNAMFGSEKVLRSRFQTVINARPHSP